MENEDGSFSPPLKPNPTAFERLHSVVQLFKNSSKFSIPMSMREFALSYRAQKQKMYLNAVDSLEMDAISKKDSYVKAFLKFEKYNFRFGEKRVVPRVISPRGPRYCVAVGRYIRPIEKLVYRTINKKMFDEITVFKGLNAQARGTAIHRKWSKFSNPVAFGLDAKRFDRHVSREALKFEHSVYQTFYPRERELKRLLGWQLRNTCFMSMKDGEIRYRTDGTRMSGDMNTALGNCLISCSILYLLRQESGIYFEACNDGDDCVLILEKDNLDKLLPMIPGFFREFGFIMEIEKPVYILEEIEFCQCKPVFVDGHYIMVRNPLVSLAKDCVVLKPIDNPKVFRKWLSAVGGCGLSLTGGIPIFQEFYSLFIRTSKGAKPLIDPTLVTGFSMMAEGMHRKYSPISPETRASFYYAFGIPPEAQEAIEERYRNATLVDHVLDDTLEFAMLPLGDPTPLNRVYY